MQTFGTTKHSMTDGIERVSLCGDVLKVSKNVEEAQSRDGTEVESRDDIQSWRARTTAYGDVCEC